MDGSERTWPQYSTAGYETHSVYLRERRDFNDEDQWQLEKGEKGRLDMFNELRTRWIGKTIFLVDRKYSREYGTDQRRQRTDAGIVRDR